MNDLRRFLNVTTLYVICGLGIAAALILFTIEVNSTPAIEFGDPSGERQADGSAVVHVRATNTTDEPKCPEVRIAARDTDGNDLAEAVAEQVGDRNQVNPGERVTFRAHLTGISDQEYEEEFDEYAAYVWDMHDCP